MTGQNAERRFPVVGLEGDGRYWRISLNLEAMGGEPAFGGLKRWDDAGALIEADWAQSGSTRQDQGAYCFASRVLDIVRERDIAKVRLRTPLLPQLPNHPLLPTHLVERSAQERLVIGSTHITEGRDPVKTVVEFSVTTRAMIRGIARSGETTWLSTDEYPDALNNPFSANKRVSDEEMLWWSKREVSKTPIDEYLNSGGVPLDPQKLEDHQSFDDSWRAHFGPRFDWDRQDM